MELKNTELLNNSNTVISDLKQITITTMCTLSEISQQYCKNNPTDFNKWKINIKEAISISVAIGVQNGLLAPRWMRSYITRKNVPYGTIGE